MAEKTKVNRTGPGEALKILSKDELAVLGEIAVATALAEHFVHIAIWYLLKLDDDKGLAVTGPLQLNQTISLLGALAALDNRKVVSKKLIPIVQALDKARPERNKKLHAIWVHDTELTSRFAKNLRGDKRSFMESNVTLDDLLEARETVRAAGGALVNWLTERKVVYQLSEQQAKALASLSKFFRQHREQIQSRSPTPKAH